MTVGMRDRGTAAPSETINGIQVVHYATGIRADIMHTADVEDATTIQFYTDMSRGSETRLGGLDVYLHG
jgi:hypothetical protein